MTDYPGTVSFEVRFYVPPDEMPELVERIENLVQGTMWDLEYPTPDTLPYADVTDLLGN